MEPHGPHDASQIVTAVKAVLVRDGLVLLVRRAQAEPFGPGVWEFPGGKLDFGETLEQALTREVAEETGLQVEAGPLLFASAPVYSPRRQLTLLHYLCTEVQGEVRLSQEHDAFEWASRPRMEALLAGPVIEALECNDVFERLDELVL